MAVAISQKLLNAASTDETTATTPAAFRSSGCRRTVHTIEWGTGVSAGVVQVEAASNPDYSGTWMNLGTFTYDSGSPKAVSMLTEGPHGALRHRISTAIAGGTVTSYIEGEAD